VAEDRGWYVRVINQEFHLWIGRGIYEEYDDGYLCIIEPRQPFVRKLFRKIDTRGRVASLQRAMDKVLNEENGIRAKRWWAPRSSITRTEMRHPQVTKS
jgi:hypothetical protein